MKPHVINYHITNQCNFHCTYCFAKCHQNALPSPLAGQVIDSICDYFSENEIENGRINISGGEPLLYPYLDAIIDYIASKNIKLSIITNGSLLTEERVKKWEGKIETIGISIDAKSKKGNQMIGRWNENTPSWEHFRKIADAIHQSGIELKINTIVSKMNLEEDLLSVYQELMPNRLKFLCLHVLDHVNEDAIALLPTSEEFDCFVKKNRYDLNCKVVIEGPHSMQNSYLMIDPNGEVYSNSNGKLMKHGHCFDEPLSKLFLSVLLDEDLFFKRYQ